MPIDPQAVGSRQPMRATSILGSVLAAATLALAGTAAAAPVVTLKAEPLPVAGHPHTGYILGAGTTLQAEYTISGTEYGGFPPPLIGVNFYLPAGTIINGSAFPTCPPATLEPSGQGPRACPKGSSAGPPGSVTGYVAFGTSIVPETATIEPFYAPGGGLEFFTFGHEPVLLEILSRGHYANYDRDGFGEELVSQVPLVETVPGAQDASVEKISVRVGSAIEKGGRTIYYGMLPKTCPKGGFTVRSELTFAGLGGLTQTTVPVSYKAPCPARHLG
jgi:hypothetical protein